MRLLHQDRYQTMFAGILAAVSATAPFLLQGWWQLDEKSPPTPRPPQLRPETTRTDAGEAQKDDLLNRLDPVPDGARDQVLRPTDLERELSYLRNLRSVHQAIGGPEPAEVDERISATNGKLTAMAKSR